MNALLARHAECLFWYGRYTERAVCLARILETQASFAQRRATANNWAWLLDLYRDQKGFSDRYNTVDADNVIWYCVMDPENAGSIRSCLHSARENARVLRSQIPVSLWQQINTFYRQFKGLKDYEVGETRLPRTCEIVKRECYAQLGVADSTVYRDESWYFLKLGILIERADQMSRLLDVRFAQIRAGHPDATREGMRHQTLGDFGLWAILLRAAASHHSFLRAVSGNRDPQRVARFLIFDRCLPRSIWSCVNEIYSNLNTLRGTFSLRNSNSPLATCDQIIRKLNAASRQEDLIENLHEFNDDMQFCLITLTNDLSDSFFAPYQSAKQEQGQFLDKKTGTAGQSQS